MKKPRWVRGKALETLLALKGLQVGDEIKITRPRDMQRNRWLGERAVVLSRLDDNDGFVAMINDCPCDRPRHCGAGLHIRFEDIKAWRPRGKT